MDITGIEIPKCRLCMEVFSAEVYMCTSGHSLCSNCLSLINPRICPRCPSDTFSRNRDIELLILKINKCGNNNLGCNWVVKGKNTVKKHMEECPYRVIECPQAVVFGSCAWKGYVKHLMQHCKKFHANMCYIKTNIETMVLVPLAEDKLSVHLFLFDSKIFILTAKISSYLKLAYWALQHVGSDERAKEYIYEFYITSHVDKKIKYVFTESCHCDSIKADELFDLNHCAIVPLDALKHYLKEDNLIIKLIIKKLSPKQPKDDNNKE